MHGGGKSKKAGEKSKKVINDFKIHTREFLRSLITSSLLESRFSKWRTQYCRHNLSKELKNPENDTKKSYSGVFGVADKNHYEIKKNWPKVYSITF